MAQRHPIYPSHVSDYEKNRQLAIQSPRGYLPEYGHKQDNPLIHSRFPNTGIHHRHQSNPLVTRQPLITSLPRPNLVHSAADLFPRGPQPFNILRHSGDDRRPRYDYMIKQGGKLYKRRTTGIHERLLAYHDNVPNRETRTHSGSGLLIYGIRMDTGESAPFLFIKTKWIDKEIRTQIPIPSNYVIVRKPIDLIVVDLSEYDNYVPDFDAYIVNLGGDFALGGGLGAGLQFVLIPQGNSRGLYVYRPSLPNFNFGLVGSIGASVGVIDFNKRSGVTLDRNLFRGRGQGWNAGASIGPIGFSRGKSTSYKDGKWHSLPTEKDTITYEAYFGAMTTVGFKMDFASIDFYSWLGRNSRIRKIGAGASYTFSESEILASYPF